MIELKVDNDYLVLPDDASISIERNSPVLNDKVGAFSYPFTVPTEDNEAALGFPGRQSRANSISPKNFKLFEDGRNIISGEIDFDSVTKEETGIILQSGKTEFSKRMDGVSLSDINFGSESFPQIYKYPNFPPDSTADTDFNNMLQRWTDSNTTNNGKYRCVPFSVADLVGIGTGGKVVNTLDAAGDITFDAAQPYFCLQFQLNFIVSKIFEQAGYTIKENGIVGSDIENVLVFGKIMRISVLYFAGNSGTEKSIQTPYIDELHYSYLMPDVNVLDFIENISTQYCLTFDINERTKAVSIFFTKSVFEAGNVVNIKDGAELDSFTHYEETEKDGFILKYQNQDDELANEYEYSADSSVNAYGDLPSPSSSYADAIIRVANTNREYKCIEVDSVFEWVQIGRLKPYFSGNAENEFEISCKIPVNQEVTIDAMGIDIDTPHIGVSLVRDDFTDIGIYITLWRGIRVYGGSYIPFISSDQYSVDGSHYNTFYLHPECLYNNFYRDYVRWNTYRARQCEKFIELPLAEALELSFRKRYRISGIPILLNKISSEHPYPGYIKIEGYTT